MALRRRTFREIRDIILLSLEGAQTINQLANTCGINWRTVEAHLTHLIGKGLVLEIFKSDYVRIFKRTQEGDSRVLQLKATEPRLEEAQEAML